MGEDADTQTEWRTRNTNFRKVNYKADNLTLSSSRFLAKRKIDVKLL
jgi:hypothetical protein